MAGGRSVQNRGGRWLAVGAGAVFAALALHAARVETPTVDEFAHVPAGLAYLEHGTIALYAKNPPGLQTLLALPLALRGDVAVPRPRNLSQGWGPWIYGTQLMRANPERYLELFWPARAVVIALVCATGWLLYRWARDLYGEGAAGFACALFFLNPLVLAHGHLATVDAGAMLAIFASAAALRWACATPQPLRLAAAGGVFGLALLVKFTAAVFAPALALLVLASRWPKLGRAAGDLALLAASALLVVNLALGFDGSFRALGGYPFASTSLETLRAWLPAWLPVPLPETWLVGFDAARRDTESGEFGSYLLGEWSLAGWWYYDLVAFAVKNPLPLLALLLAAPLGLRRLPRRELLFVALPAVVLFGLMSGFNRVHLGLRYLLPIYPFLFLAAASLAWRTDSPRARIALAAALVWHVVAVAAVHPNHLAYFNLAAGGPAGGHRLLLDSNLDWGQDLYRLGPALEELDVRGRVGLLYFGHVDPGLYGIDYELVPDAPVEGVLAVSVNYLMGYRYPVTAPDGRLLPVRRDHLAWLRSRQPVARAGTLWIFDTRGQGTSDALSPAPAP